jgi:hypothetical protein
MDKDTVPIQKVPGVLWHTVLVILCDRGHDSVTILLYMVPLFRCCDT